MIQAKRAAFSGVIAALCVAFMFMGSLFSIFVYFIPAACGVIIMTAAYALGEKYGYCIYLVVAALSALFVPDKECMMIFVFFFGFYPLLRDRLEAIKPRPVSFLIRFLIFNACVIGAEYLLFRIFGINILEDGFGKWFLPVMLVMMNLFFVIYDFVLGKFKILYFLKWKRRVDRLMKK